MRDGLPAEARAQTELGRRIIGSFELHGYELVNVPMFEYAEVLERGLGALELSEVLRFVEPETGAVVALRPDMTPQVARLLATRLADAPLPARLCYQGSVLRRRRERARRHRQIPQAGVELVGAPGLAGDLEILTVAASTIRATGLAEFVIDLGHAGVTTSLLEGLPADHVSGIVEALNLRDEREAVARAERAGLTGPALRALGSLPELHGGADLWERAERALAGTRALNAVRELRQLVDAAEARSLAPRFIVDLAESRDFAYYTGAVFHVHARGPGQPIGAGGRYDSLYERFGSPRPAAGFALRLDDLRWALEAAGVLREEPARVLVDGRLESLLTALRRRGVASAVAPAEDAPSYARAWRFTHAVEWGATGAELLDVRLGGRRVLPSDPEAAALEVSRTVATAATRE
jgi:ATP phosphoribosyltransferase regulatory subunit